MSHAQGLDPQWIKDGLAFWKQQVSIKPTRKAKWNLSVFEMWAKELGII